VKASTVPRKNPLSSQLVQRILRTVPYEESFRFSMGFGEYTGEGATNLENFAEILKTVDLRSINFHMERHDFEKWVHFIFGDEELAQRISRRGVFQGENLRNELRIVVLDRLDELKKMAKVA
jgi:hypothetical protein